VTTRARLLGRPYAKLTLPITRSRVGSCTLTGLMFSVGGLILTPPRAGLCRRPTRSHILAQMNQLFFFIVSFPFFFFFFFSRGFLAESNGILRTLIKRRVAGCAAWQRPATFKFTA